MKVSLRLLILLIGWNSLNAQVEDIKLMTYNLLFYKASNSFCTHSRTASQRDADLKTIIQDVQPDLLCVNELGDNPVNPLVILSDILNVDGVNYYERAASTNNSSSSIVNMLFYNKNKLVLHSQHKIERDVNNAPLIRVIDFYRLYVKDQGLGSAGVDTVWINVAALHLKAGQGSSNEQARARAAAAVMDYIGRELPGENVLVAGDFNVYQASEPAFQTFINYTANPSVSLNDPINQLGNWNNNSNFAAYHTQSTHASGTGCFSGGGMDDRFDMILASDAVMNASQNLSYVDYETVGQDGGGFNGNLPTTNNFFYNQTLATALYNFSDHLPVVIELEASVSGIGLSEENRLERSWQTNNPFGDELTIRFNSGNWHPQLEIEIINLTGASLYQGQLKLQSGKEILKLPTSDWASGIYLINIRTESGQSLTRKLIKS
jgi:exonuclease III